MPGRSNAALKTISIDAWKAKVTAAAKTAEGKPDASTEASVDSSDPANSLAPGLRDLQDQTVVKARILIVDADSHNILQVSGILEDLNHELIAAVSTEEAMFRLAQSPIDLIIVDLHIPEIGGIAFCERIRKAEATQMLPVFIRSASDDRSLEARAMSAGADEFLAAPHKPAALRARVHATLRHRAMMKSLDDSETILFSLAKSVEDRDPDLGQHCQRLALMAAGMGIALGLPPADIRSLHRGGYLHDIGKIAIPDRILFKAGPLTAEEWEIMKSHADRGERFCACTKSLASVLPIIRHHHEKFDGSGYPDGLSGEEIPLLARIVQVVDIYDALTTERPYKRAYSSEEALAIMRDETKKGWRDPHLVEVLAELLPVFRNRMVVDSATLSLQALADSLEQYRVDSLRRPTLAAANFTKPRTI